MPLRDVRGWVGGGTGRAGPAECQMLQPRCTLIMADVALGGIHGKKELLQHRRWKGSTSPIAAGDSQAQGPSLPPHLPFSKRRGGPGWSRTGGVLCWETGGAARWRAQRLSYAATPDHKQTHVCCLPFPRVVHTTAG